MTDRQVTAIIRANTMLANCLIDAIRLASLGRQEDMPYIQMHDILVDSWPIEPPAPVEAEPVAKDEQSDILVCEGISIAPDGFRRYTREFKIGLCEKLKTRRLTKSQALKAFQLSSGMVDRWLDAYATKGGNAFPRTQRQAVPSVQPVLPTPDPAPALDAHDQLDPRFPGKSQAYAREFKVELCQKIISGQIASCTEAASMFQIDMSLIAKWVRQYRQLGKKAFRNSPIETPVVSDDLLKWVEKHGGQIRVQNGQVVYNRDEVAP